MRKNFYYSRRTKRRPKTSRYDESLIMLAILIAFGITLAISYVAIEYMYS